MEVMDSDLLMAVAEMQKNFEETLTNEFLDLFQDDKDTSKVSTPTKRKADSKIDSHYKEKRTRKGSSHVMEPLSKEKVINKMKSVLSSDKTEVTAKNISQIKKKDTPKNTTNNVQDIARKTTKLIEAISTTIKCNYCQKPFENKVLLSKHLLTHDEWRPYVCQRCPMRFCSNSSLTKHFESKHPNADMKSQCHTCRVCNQSFSRSESYEEHFKCHVKKNTIFKCIFCYEPFISRLKLIDHERSHSKESQQFKCDYCALNFPDEKCFWIHMERHSHLKDWICHYCGKDFLRLDGLKRHFRMYNDGSCQAKICPICNKRLKGHMSEHLRTHEQKRPHVCNICGQRFAQTSQLTVHKRAHTGDRPYPCKICQKQFRYSSALMLHTRKHTGEKPFECPMCPLAFAQLPHMKTHMLKIHKQEHTYQCSKCNEYFKFKKYLVVHEANCNVVMDMEEEADALLPDAKVNKKNMTMSLSTMRFLAALLMSKVADQEQLKCLGFNKRLIDDLVEDSIDAIGLQSCKDTTKTTLNRLRTNIEILFGGIVSQEQMDYFHRENKSIEEILILLTGDDVITDFAKK